MPRFPKLLFADDILWMRLMLHSWKATTAAECFSYRLHSASTAGAAALKSWVEAAQCYIAGLQELSEQDADVAHVYATHGSGYFQEWLYEVWMRALWETTKTNRHLEPGIQKAILAQAAYVSPQVALRFKRNKKIRLHQAINSNFLTRRLYTAYIRVRFGNR